MIALAAFEDALPYHAFGSRLLKLQTPQMTGTDVKVFQHLFNQFVQFSRPSSGPIGTPVTEDGIFGPATDAAARQWQRYFNLAVDGVLGQDTYFTLGQGVGSRTTYGGPVFGSRGLASGSSGGDVKIAQNRLSVFRYWAALVTPADGIFGPHTKTAVQQFQGDLNTVVTPPDTGVPTDGAIHFETFDGFWAYTFAGGRGLFQGRNGIDTLFVQKFLHDERPQFYTGALDGLFGPKTEAAVRAFQTFVGIAADGAVGPQTFFQIGKQFNQAAGIWP